MNKACYSTGESWKRSHSTWVAGKTRMNLSVCVHSTVLRAKHRISTCSNNLGCMTLRGSHTHIGFVFCLGLSNQLLGTADHNKLQGQSNLNQPHDGLNMETPSPPESRRNSSRQGKGLSDILFLFLVAFPLANLPCQFQSRLPHVAKILEGSKS